tara:strand:- start:1791 stop:2735 length:945 start_codon:yes stop_codon:yes gene_type:complete
MKPLDRDDFENYLQLMLDKPDKCRVLAGELISKLDTCEPGVALGKSMNQWFGHKSLLGATSPASLISWLDASTSPTMKWVIRDSVSSCMASVGIENLRELATYRAGTIIASLQRQANLQISEKKQFLELVKVLNRSACIDLIDAIELIDAVICERIDLVLAASNLRGMLKVIKLYVLESGDNWPIHQGSIKVFGFEVGARLIVILLKKMIMADQVVDPKEMVTFYKILGQRYSIPPEQARWIFEAAPLDFDIAIVCRDVLGFLHPEKVTEVYDILKAIAIADNHFDQSEQKLLGTIQDCLTIQMSIGGISQEDD